MLIDNIPIQCLQSIKKFVWNSSIISPKYLTDYWYQYMFVVRRLLIFVWLRHFFNCYLAAPWQTLGHYRGGSLTHPMSITTFLHIFNLEVTIMREEPSNEVGSLSPIEHLMGFEPWAFQFWLQYLNPLGHSPYFVDWTTNMFFVLFWKFIAPALTVFFSFILVLYEWRLK